jgi:hypothetical protein
MPQQAGHDPEQGRLPAAARTEEREEPAGRQVEANPRLTPASAAIPPNRLEDLTPCPRNIRNVWPQKPR